MGEWKKVRLGDIADVNWGDTSTTKASYVSHWFPAIVETIMRTLISNCSAHKNSVKIRKGRK